MRSKGNKSNKLFNMRGGGGWGNIWIGVGTVGCIASVITVEYLRNSVKTDNAPSRLWMLLGCFLGMLFIGIGLAILPS